MTPLRKTSQRLDARIWTSPLQTLAQNILSDRFAGTAQALPVTASVPREIGFPRPSQIRAFWILRSCMGVCLNA